MGKLFKDPLIHFLLIGALLFVFYEIQSKPELTPDNERIVVSSGRVDQLVTIFTRTWQRPPTEEELESLVEDFILEEAYYRQAKEMGIDQDDTLIRRRLRQKLEFLTEDATVSTEPSEEELQSYLAENADYFYTDRVFTFRQLYFNAENAGAELEATLAASLETLNSGGMVEHGRSLIPEQFENAPERVVDNTFGLGFSDQLEQLPIGQWGGPLQSGLGYHLVKLEMVISSELPELAKIRPIVMREWNHERRMEMRTLFNEDLLKQYEIVIEWPEQENAAEQPTG